MLSESHWSEWPSELVANSSSTTTEFLMIS